MAAQFFAPEAALPGACAAVMHNVNGAIYAFLVCRLDGRRVRATVPAREREAQSV